MVRGGWPCSPKGRPPATSWAASRKRTVTASTASWVSSTNTAARPRGLEKSASTGPATGRGTGTVARGTSWHRRPSSGPWPTTSSVRPDRCRSGCSRLWRRDNPREEIAGASNRPHCTWPKKRGSYGGYLDRYVDLRVDDHAAPIIELRKLLELHRLYFGTTPTGALTRAAGNVTRAIQQLLHGLGYYSGEISGIYDPATKAAFKQFCSIENFEERWRDDDLVDRQIIAFMRKRLTSKAST